MLMSCLQNSQSNNVCGSLWKQLERREDIISLFKVAQQGYARSWSARQWPQSKVNILVPFAIFLIKTTET